MQSTPLDISNLISHRFRGFSKHENTLDGLLSALEYGVQLLEFDVRVAACGTPMVYHDQHARDKNGVIRNLGDFKASSFPALGGDFVHMPTFDAALGLVILHGNKTAKLLVDIKDLGFEHEIHALIMRRKLAPRCIYVSWVPETLFRLHDMAPDIPLCLSHWCKPVNIAIKATHKVYVSKDGHIPRRTEQYSLGERSGWSVLAPLSGDIFAILKASNGGVCVPQNMIIQSLSEFYHEHGLFVSTFSYTDWKSIYAHRDKFNIDYYFIDKKRVFDELPK